MVSQTFKSKKLNSTLRFQQINSNLYTIFTQYITIYSYIKQMSNCEFSHSTLLSSSWFLYSGSDRNANKHKLKAHNKFIIYACQQSQLQQFIHEFNTKFHWNCNPEWDKLKYYTDAVCVRLCVFVYGSCVATMIHCNMEHRPLLNGFHGMVEKVLPSN